MRILLISICISISTTSYADSKIVDASDTMEAAGILSSYINTVRVYKFMCNRKYEGYGSKLEKAETHWYNQNNALFEKNKTILSKLSKEEMALFNNMHEKASEQRIMHFNRLDIGKQKLLCEDLIHDLNKNEFVRLFPKTIVFLKK